MRAPVRSCEYAFLCLRVRYHALPFLLLPLLFSPFVGVDTMVAARSKEFAAQGERECGGDKGTTRKKKRVLAVNFPVHPGLRYACRATTASPMEPPVALVKRLGE